jgi:xanthine/CO dehydrogenase XdhC/CoxF family maturation factor
MKDVYDILRAWKNRQAAEASGGLALTTLVRAAGSSYRRPGARMLVYEDGTTIGSLSAGCLEEEVAICARKILRHGEPQLLSFDTRRRFGCAGKIDIFIERIDERWLADLALELDRRRSCFVVTKFDGNELGSRMLCYENEDEPEHEYELIQQIHPPIRLLIFGDGPDNAPLGWLGEMLGWQVTHIADPNSLVHEADDWTAAIVKSHNYGRDFVALMKLLPLGLRYVGLIGPRKRRDQLINELLELGVTINAGFFAPAGIDISAETPQEIALSIIAEIQRVFGKGTGESLRERKMPIHSSLTRTEATNPMIKPVGNCAGSFDSASLRSE